MWCGITVFFGWCSFLSHREWRHVNFCTADEDLTLRLLKIRPVTSSVDNLETAWISELFFLIPAVWKCQTQDLFSCYLIPLCAKSCELLISQNTLQEFFHLYFSFSFPIPSSSVLIYYGSLWVSGSLCKICNSDVTPLLTKIRRQPEGFLRR